MAENAQHESATPSILRDAAIIVVSYGSSHLLEHHLLPTAQSVPEAAVVVVDNYTSEEEQMRVSEICAEHGWRAILSPYNSGFGVGVNLGASAAIAGGAEILVVLNPDAAIDRHSIVRIVEAVAAAPSTMVAPVIKTGDGRIWFDGMHVDLESGRARRTRNHPAPVSPLRRPWLTGACFAVSVEMWTRVEGFDGDYFLYWEDVDLSYRVIRAGGDLVVDTSAEAVHHVGGTQSTKGRAKSEVYYYFNIRNRLLYAAKTLDDAGMRAWARSSFRASVEILLRGGRRQFLNPVPPVRALVRGLRDGLLFVRDARRNRVPRRTP